jgi:hypothetical protein
MPLAWWTYLLRILLLHVVFIIHLHDGLHSDVRGSERQERACQPERGKRGAAP